MIIFHLAQAALTGYAAHQSYRLTSRLQNGWSQLSAYTLGVLFNLPFGAVIHDDLKEVRSPVARFVLAYLLSFFAFGAGTVVGWIFHPIDGPMLYPVQDEE